MSRDEDVKAFLSEILTPLPILTSPSQVPTMVIFRPHTPPHPVCFPFSLSRRKITHSNIDFALVQQLFYPQDQYSAIYRRDVATR